MDNTVIVALISAGGSTLTAITALLLNYRGFASLESRLSSTDNRISSLESRITSLENRVHTDLSEFYRLLTDLDKRVARLEDKR